VRIHYDKASEGSLDNVHQKHDDWDPKYYADPRHATVVVSMSWDPSDIILAQGEISLPAFDLVSGRTAKE